MSISTKYDPKATESKWYKHWMDQGYFQSKPNPDKAPYSIVIPPPNVTGMLHMGHMLNNTIQDILIRKARMEGKEACWVPGTDHASIATEAKVVVMLKEKGIAKEDISREEFLRHAWEWKEKYGGIILEQLKKLGASCDWSRTRFTMEEALSESVTKVFVDFYKKGYIYRGKRMINWDPEGKTALADDEVIYRETNAKLYYVNYKLTDSDESITIATVRPETILGDTAICVNPKDKRYKHLKGKKVVVPLTDREIPVIQDSYVSMDFGTGCLKVTPAHDLNDYQLGIKHKLPTIDVLTDSGKMSEAAGIFIGEDRFVARKKVAAAIEAAGQMVKIEDYKTNVGYSERTNAVVEPRLSVQWFVKMEHLVKPALKNVLNDEVRFNPPKFKNMYRSWMENVHDWCISRQLWWGHRIPAYYLPDGSFVVAETPEEALKLAKKASKNKDLTPDDLRQDEDVLDTWFSSGLWPITVFDGIRNPENEDIRYYYPTSVLVTGFDIIFFWIARMIIYGYEYRQEKPFEDVYFTGMVRDSQRRKMSKQLGNSPDPLELISTYGADGVRTGMLFSAPAGNDLLFDVKLCEQGRNFANKIWNAFRLVKSWEIDESLDNNRNQVAIAWFEARFNQALIEVEDHFSKYRISDALLTIYNLTWDAFCSSYLEMVKPDYQQPIDKVTCKATHSFFKCIMKLLHPFMPFITEEIWQQIRHEKDEECVIVAAWPKGDTEEGRTKMDMELIQGGTMALDIVSNIRNLRNSKQIADKQPLSLLIKTDFSRIYQLYDGIIRKLANIESIEFTDEKPEGAASFIINAMQGRPDELFVPLKGAIDIDEEISKIRKELEYTKGFLSSVEKKLSNQKFVNSAPEQVVAMERKKKSDAEAKIAALEENLSSLSN